MIKLAAVRVALIVLITLVCVVIPAILTDH